MSNGDTQKAKAKEVRVEEADGQTLLDKIMDEGKKNRSRFVVILSPKDPR